MRMDTTAGKTVFATWVKSIDTGIVGMAATGFYFRNYHRTWRADLEISMVVALFGSNLSQTGFTV